MSDSAVSQAQVDELLNGRLCELRKLSFHSVTRLPQSVSEEFTVDGRKWAVTTFAQPLEGDQYLVTVQFSRRTSLGFGNTLQERGLVFSPSADVREASAAELLSSGG